MWQKSHDSRERFGNNAQCSEHTTLARTAFARPSPLHKPSPGSQNAGGRSNRNAHELGKQGYPIFHPWRDADAGVERRGTAGAVKSSSGATGAAAARTASGTKSRAAFGAKSRAAFGARRQ